MTPFKRKNPDAPVEKSSGAWGLSMNLTNGASSDMAMMAPRPVGDGKVWVFDSEKRNWALATKVP